MHNQNLPSQQEMISAFLHRDPSYEGIFVTAVKTTGIFCRPTCSARKPKVENVEFFSTPKDALLAGYRSCKRCQPMQALGLAPEWLNPLLAEVELDNMRRWRDQDLRERGLQPERVRRWFKRNHGLTFHAYVRARRLAAALNGIQNGKSILDSAFDSGYGSLSGFNEAFANTLGITPSQSKDALPISISRISTPLGPMIAAASAKSLFLLEYADRPMLETQFKRLAKQMDCLFVLGKNEVLEQCEQQLAAYFARRLQQFSIPLQTPGTTFQKSVWRALADISYGETASYLQIAQSLGNPKAVRAVARANGDNRIAIIIPCHRVIGSDGSLTGYGGGLWRKQRLLEIEKDSISPPLPLPYPEQMQTDLL